MRWALAGYGFVETVVAIEAGANGFGMWERVEDGRPGNRGMASAAGVGCPNMIRRFTLGNVAIDVMAIRAKPFHLRVIDCGNRCPGRGCHGVAFLTEISTCNMACRLAFGSRVVVAG